VRGPVLSQGDKRSPRRELFARAKLEGGGEEKGEKDLSLKGVKGSSYIVLKKVEENLPEPEPMKEKEGAHLGGSLVPRKVKGNRTKWKKKRRGGQLQNTEEGKDEIIGR